MNEHLLKEYRELSEELGSLTRIERLARRFPVQIEFINRAIKETKEVDGAILELGLGEGRTLEYLERITSAPIFVFEIDEKTNLHFCRASTQLVKGDLFKTLPQMLGSQELNVRMVHADIGTTDYFNDISRIEPLRAIIEKVVSTGGVLVCDRPIIFQGFKLLANSHKSGWPYYLWKKI